MRPNLVLQPEGSELCGQCCVAMAAGVSLAEAVRAVGHEGGTYTRDIVAAFEKLGVPSASRCKVLSRTKPVPPKRAILAIHQPPKEGRRRKGKWHWLLHWDGEILDPGGCWGTEHYKDWRITSALEIFS